MKRIIIITLITCLLIPFFCINISAAEYDLGVPSFWYTVDVFYNSLYSNAFTILGNDIQAFNQSYRLLFYPNGYQTEGGFDDSYAYDLNNIYSNLSPLGSYSDASYRYRIPDLDHDKNVLAFCSADSVRNTLCMPGIVFQNIMIPEDNQYFKVEFSVDTVKLGTSLDIPSLFDSVLKPEYLCFFEVEDNSLTSAPSSIVPFTSVVLNTSNNGRLLTFTYYFSSQGKVFDELRENNESGLLNLVIRFPYYFGNTSLVDDGVFILSNYDFPSSYEIITPGGYSQELEGIQNAIISSNENLMDYYDTLSGEDQAVIIHAKQQNDKLDSTIKDYDNAQSGIDKIVEAVTLPPVNVDDANSTFDQIGLGNIAEHEGLWSIEVVTMVLITFTFASLSLILYGKKG